MSETIDNEVLDFGKLDGLIAAVIQDASTRRVLMVGFMNHEAFDRTLATGYVTFFSRSRKKLWMKGESSGHYLVVKSIRDRLRSRRVAYAGRTARPRRLPRRLSELFLPQAGKRTTGSKLIPRAYDPEVVYGARQ